MQSFDQQYWEQHWDTSPASTSHRPAANPYMREETSDLPPGTALDAGCGTGAEAIWLATHGWTVTGADISGSALTAASTGGQTAGVEDRLTWIEADLTSWDPDNRWDLVTTNYAHSTLPQLVFYQRISEWVAPHGTLLIIGHLHDQHPHPDAHSHAHSDRGPHSGSGSGHQHPPEATVTLASTVASLDSTHWTIHTARENTRTVMAPTGHKVELRDVIVRATRNS